MSTNNSEREHIYKYFRGKWKELGVDDKKTIPHIEEKEHCLKDLENKSVIELEELIIRQEKLLSNKSFISKLNDKGLKLQQKLKNLQNALKVAKEVAEKASENQKNFTDIYSIEWHGHVNESDENNFTKNSRHKINEEDDENNPLQLLARHSVDYPENIQNRKFRAEDEKASELIAKELEKLSIEDAEDETNDADPIRDKSSASFFEKKCLDLESNRPKFHRKECFRPNRSLKENMKPSNKSVMIPIAESLKLMAEAHSKERDKVYSEAAGVLQQSTPIGMTLPTTNNLNYRDANTTQHLLEEYEDDINDFIYSEHSEDEDTHEY